MFGTLGHQVSSNCKSSTIDDGKYLKPSSTDRKFGKSKWDSFPHVTYFSVIVGKGRENKENDGFIFFLYLAWGWEEMKSTATLMVLILSASLSGISNPNSSSSAITTSTASKLSNPRSVWKLAVGVTWRQEKADIR